MNESTNPFLLVLSNIKHNGEMLLKGNVFQAELASFEHLVEMGVLKVIKGAQTMDQALEIVKSDVEAAAAKAAAVKAPEPVWAPKPNPTTEAAAPAAPAEQSAPAADPATAPQAGAGDQPPADPAAAPAAPQDTGANL